MSYTKPTIDESGYHYPSYQEILTGLVEDVQAICGSDVYLGSDSMDYQLISIFALKIYDCYQAVELAYNSHSPVTAIGTGLDYIVALNGITRIQGTQSVVNVVLMGTPNQIIQNGKVSDINGVLWDLPASVTLDEDGKATVEAVCENTGITIAEPHTIIRIMTPTSGWISVDNPDAATTGTITESDSHLRARQALTVSAVSRSILNGLKGALLELKDVQRVEILENDTSVTDDNGLPPHSICCIVDGGDNTDIGKTILKHKSIGCGTYGGSDETESMVDVQDGEYLYNIRFCRPRKVPIETVISIKRRNGYSSYYEEKIRVAINSYVSTYAIGTSFVTSMLWSTIQSVIDDPTNPPFYITDITAARAGGEQAKTNVEMNYYEYADCPVTGITINVD